MDASVMSTTYALSAAQTEIWLAQQLYPDSPVYNIAQYTVIEGAIEPAVFEAALRQVIDEADTLRLQFIDSDDGLRQRIGAPAWSMPVLDLTAQADPQAAAQAWMRTDYQQPVNLTQGPLFCYALLKVAPAQWMWYQRYHHIMMDGYGRCLIAQRVAYVYSALCEGTTPAACDFGSIRQLVESDAQYQISAQRAQDEAYWLKHCADWSEPATLASRSAPVLQQRLRQTTYLAIQALGDTAPDARRLAQFMTAAMAAYLYRFTGEHDVVLGLPVKARFDADRHIPGMKSNTLPLRLTMRPGMNLSSLMQQAAQEMQSGLRHQRYPSEALRRQLGMPSGQRLFGTTVNVMPFDLDLSFGGYSATNHNLLNGPAEDLMLGVYWTPGSHQLRIDFDANPACYTPEGLGAHQRRFIRFMQVLAADATQPIDSIDLLYANERHRLLVEWNATQRDYPAHLCVHQLFEAQVERTPKATALVYEDQTLSYTQLNAQANRLAHQLIELGVKPDVRVAICVERSPALVVGLLAILKAGGAYVPLDPSYPGERLAHILGNAEPNMVLADAAGRTALGEAALAECTVLDPATLPALPDTNPSVAELTARHLAYVIYTSGSTGTPKGVMVEHRNVANLCAWHNRKFGVQSGCRSAFMAGMAFDASAWELWPSLIGGGMLSIPSQAVCEQVLALLQWWQQQLLDVAFLVTPLAEMALADQRTPAGLRYLLTGGERFPGVTRALPAGLTLVNQYGPTEATVVATSGQLSAEDTLPHIGRPIDNTRIYILDAYRQPVPLGAVGELYIGGAGVARGYLNRPELTAERFVPDPFSEDADARLYKTGDLARYLPDGNLEFLGRNDDQVKIRGFRIEPGEIEACLMAHSQVRDAVVLATGESQDKRLVAYVVAKPDEALVSTLWAHVSARLPEYMVPSAFVRLDALPLTPNGKLDRRALPAPDDEALAHQAYEAPQGELETTLATIWAELLGVERVGRHDNFFALGGHSLLAVRLMNRVRGLGADVPLATLFATPTLAAFAAALEAHLQQGTDALSELTPVSRKGSLPLSFAQQRLWFLAQLDGISESYHMPLALHVRGPLDRAAWQQALDALFARHEALRSTFVSVEGQPQVRLLPVDTGVPLRWHDLRGVPHAQAQLARLSHEAAHAPFDLAQGPLMRACGIQVADEEHVVLLTQHHIVSDGWSIGVLARELSALYAASVGAQADPLPPLAVQYPDYAAWQRQWLTGERLQAQSDYWRATLADAPVLLELPTDRPRPAQQSFAGAQALVRIDAATTQALKRLSAEHGTTLFMTVLAAWSTVLARLSGQHDMVIGTPSANRNHPQIEPLIGFFVNTLALRMDLSGEPDTAELLARVRRTTLDAQAHQDLPFEQVVEIVQPPRRLNHTPLFQVMLAWQNNAPGEWRLPGLTATPAELEYDAVKFDLELNLSEAGEEVVGSLGYATALFDHATIERHVGYLQTMLRAMVACPQQPVATLQMLGSDERQLLLDTWNATQRDYPSHLCIHQLFEAQVERTPEAPALVYEAQTLSYAQLNAQANRLAHQLIELGGVKPDIRVAICVERSPALVVGVLAILKAGGAYVPLDPAYPSERLAYILADAAPNIVLADAAGRAALGDAVIAECTVLDPATLPALPDTNPSVAELTARHLAYVIYTSGSSGTPKGVMVEHAQVVRLFEATQPWYGFNEHDTWCLFHSFAFDFSVWELWGALRYGGKLVIVPHPIARSADAFYPLICEQGVTVLNQTPSAFKALMASQAHSALSDQLRYVILGGEALEPTSLQAWYATHDERHPQLFNMYGITEATVHVTYRPLRQQDSEQAGSPVGTRIPDLTIYLLDAHGQPVPLGAVGELYIGGAGVARGYLNRPELTAERFVHDPFSEDADARLYKTGDLARYLPDGNLEFMGRNDEQVKIRGFRIEPGEIEACLTAHPQVRDAVVVATGEGSAKRLVAYVQAEADEPLASTLRAHVSARLPEYMVPSAFVRLNAWPLTPNGKLDRRALPGPDDEALAHQAYAAPQGELETTLATIWAELLGVERVGRHDSFFALGGHSLLAVRLMNRVRGLGADVPLATLFATPTLAAFAAALEAHLQQGTDALPELTPVSRKGSLPLSFAQQRLWFLAQLDGVSESYHMPLALHVRGPLDRAAWQQALDALFARHEALRSTFVSVEGQPQVQLLPADMGVPLHWHDLRGMPDADAHLSRLVADEARAPFDLMRGPLMRACVVQLADDNYQCVLTQHHIVSDGWSIGVLVRELSTLYAASVGAQADPLPLLAVQYPDYAAWQRQWLTGERLQAQSDYWRATLADAPVLLELPTDRPRPAQQSFAGAQVPVQIDASTTQALKRLSAEHGTTLFMTVLAAWSAVLARLSGQHDVVIGTPSAHRNHRQIESLIGFFVNTLALRVDLSGEPDIAQLLARVRRTTLDAQAHQDLPFEQVVEIVQPPRRLNHTPLFQVMLAWQSNEPGEWRLPGLTATPAELEYEVVKFDLELNLSEVGDEIVGSLGYATALFDRSTIERHVGYLQTMLRAMVACPQQPVATLELLSPAERQLLLHTWNATQRDYPKHRCGHQLFEAQVERTPEAPALVYEAQTLSYAQLNAQANRLAHQLIELGVKPDARVAICVQRSPVLVVGVLAILKAGGAYVPLDPSYPGERLAYILADVAPNIVLADTAGRAALGEAALAERTVLDPATLSALPDTNPSVAGLTARHLAYVIYTSGSTGMPKGVMVEHRGVVNLALAQIACFGVQPASRMLQFASFNFDASASEIWMAFGSGAALYLPPEAARQDRHALWDYLASHAITHATLPPALLQHGADLPSFGLSLTLILAGEAPSATLVRDLADQGAVFNAYGPTETTVCATAWRGARDFSGEVPIGRPIANTRIYLLDAYGQPVPLGAVGELYIGGAGVARGYLNRPELTAERFVRDPFVDEPDARMYKTGDLARYLPDGNLEFLGRNDEQVKIRGFRIEPEEIEACLTAHPQVRDAVVVATGEGSDKRLVAYVQAEADEPLASTLRAHVSARLPEYMVPNAFVRLDAFPLTPNGKLDRRALPAPDDAALAHQAYEVPQGELETTLAAIWAELLGVERVGRHDSFFALGGHSLLAVRLIERLRRRGLSMSVRALFEASTLSALAQTLGQRRDVVVPPNAITPDTAAITPSMLPLIELTQADIDKIVEQVPGGVANIQDIYALSSLQDGLLFHHLLASTGDPYLLMVQLAFDTRARLDQYLHALQQVIDRHDILRTAFVWEGVSMPAQVVWRHARLPVTELTLDAADGPIAEQLARRFDPRHTRLDLTQAPLLHCAIAQDGEGRWLLTQRLHHLIGDHSTLEVMHAEVRAFIEGRGDALPPAQPFRHLVAQARLGGSQAEHERFFTEQLADIEEPTLPFGLAQVQCDGREVSESHRMLPSALTDRLRAHARRWGVSLASLCHLAWAQVLARASGQPRVVFGTVLFGRMQAGEGADRAMGLFINTLPLRVDLEGSVQAAVHATHARLAALLEHEHASLALAQRCSSVPAGTPLFSALLNYRHNAMGSDERSGLPGVELLSAQERTNYPLTLSVEDFGQSLGLTAQSVPPLEPERVCAYMQQALHSLADALEATPDNAVQQLQVLPEAERELLLNTWNATQQVYPKHRCVHQLFEAQVERTPEAPALVYEAQTLSYAQLNAQANRLAHQLIELGVKPDTCVAICVQRSAALVVGLLAILKAGGAYVPLDPSYPGERLAHILADAAPNIVLADAAGRAALGEAALVECTVLDPTTLPALPDTNPSIAELTARHLAYVIYTSGSTGTPKGVMVEHAQAVNFLCWAVQTFTPLETQHTLFATSISFDLSVYECFVPLAQGSTVHLVKDALALMHQTQPVSLINTVPSALQSLLTHGANLSSAATINLAGEPLTVRFIQQIFEQTPIQRLCNLYGPSESTTYSTWLSIQRGEAWIESIGRPIANTHVYLLDAHGQPVPLGAVGELYIGGAGVARGYLNRPKLTAERFVRDPFVGEPDARMYKTGDLARYLPDGNLEFLGRNDEQVKIRGFRIEPGEIEACLTAHPQVRDAVVLACGEGSDKRLVAYVQAEADEPLASTLRAQVAASLPEYMVPSAFVRLDAFPLTPNGKLDRRALPAPDDEALAHQMYVAPQGELETTLAAIWAELLGVERVGRHDSFFALGGHSLLAVQLIERLRRRGIGLSVRALFDTPTLSALAQTLGQHRDVAVPPNAITPDTTAITPSMLPLIELTQADIDKIVEQVPGGVANIQDIYALSPLQDGLLFHHLLASTGDPYLLMVQLAFDSRERLDQYLHALQQVIDRHDILRTAFVWEGVSMPAQVVWRHARLPVTELTLDAADGPIAEQLARRFDPRHTRLDLTQAPLLHCAIAQDSEGRWLLTQRLHHLISDHSTLDVMHAEVQAFIEGRGDTLPPAQPFRYLVAQARLGVSQAEHERFFTEQLADIEEPTLPFGLAQVQRDGREVSESHWMLPSALSDRLRAHARRWGVSLASLCHLAWAQVLARASGQQRVVFGTVLFGRMQAGEGADRAMGLFINTLPLRVDLDGSVQAAVHATHARLAALLEHEHASLALAQRCSGVPADMPLFSAMLNYRHNAMDSNERIGLPGVELLSAQERTHYPIGLSVEDFGQALGLTAQSVPPLEPERVCAYMQQALQSLADALEATPDTAVQQLQVLPEAERQLLLNIWNATQRDYPSHLCVHQLFEAQVERTPEAPALVYEDQTFSYAQLNAQANRLAHQLIEWGVKPDARVAICVERSAALVVGLLAILKAGGAYVPLDPSYPGERLAHILADAAPSIVLADAAGRAALGEAALAECTVLDPATLPALPNTNPSVADLTARHLAYVIYTSGSTGTPKGVMVEHAQLVNFLCWAVQTFTPLEMQHTLFATSISFDLSVYECFVPLAQGSTVHLVDDALALMHHTQPVSLINTVPSALQSLLAHQADLSSVVTINVAGEPLRSSLIKQAFEKTPVQRLCNLYGPSESTIYSTWLSIQRGEPFVESIGRPIANTRIYLLNGYGQPVPLGAVGELYIGGAGVARGYLNRPELTAERFVHDPFVNEAHARMYKTGDLARYLPDGNLEFLGRNDHQVKIRGFRIELGEIEARLAQHAQVRDAVVLVVGEGQDKRLVAYAVAEPDDALAGTLRTHMAAALPEYMVPSAFVRLDALPLTPNGKLDRRALPAPDADAFAHQAYEAPQGELEITLAEIWSELLGVERISRHDSFFALGGHSLLAVRLMNRVAALGIALPLATLFAAPTLTGLAAALDAQRTDSAVLPVITPVSRDSALPLSFAQQRLWFLAQLDSASDSYHILLALRLRGTLNRIAWQQALDALFVRHEALRSVFVSADGQPQVQLLPAEVRVPMAWHDLRGVPDAQAQLVRLSAEAAQAPFDLAHGPLMRACGMQLADDEYVMLLVQHHIVSDGWSISVMVRELNTLYRAACGEPADPLPALTIQYPDYAAWQRQWLSGERLQAQSEYWHTALADAPVLLALPTDRPRPAQQSFAGARVPIRIDAPTTRALKRLSQAQGATLFMTVLAAWSAVLARLSGQDDLVIGTPSANRHHPQIEPLIGFFVNTLALRVDVSGAPSPAQLLERVRRTTLEAQAHQDLPFEQVVEIVQPPRRLEHTPLFQVMFAWQNNERAVWDLPELEVTPADLADGVAKFDLDLHLYEADGEVVGWLNYATALFDRATIERHVGYLQTMLQSMAADDQHPVTRVQLLTSAERTLLLETWNATQQDYPSHQCIHQLFEAQVERTPQATALVYEEQTLSYAQLNAQANRLAHQLIELGVVPDARVAICVERSPAMVVGLLAILKAGGAYVPLDPAYPGARLAHILTDAAPDIVLADAAGRAALGEAALAHRTVLDPNTLPARAGTNRWVPALTAQHLAYVIYTSGSTGTPKGVMVEHAQAVNFLCWAVQTFTPLETQHTLFATSISFDLSVYECFVPLAQGSTVHLVKDALALMHQTQPVSLINTVPSALQSLLTHRANLSSATTINLAGEPLTARFIQQIFEQTPIQRLCNLYGPSESTTYSTWLSIQRGEAWIESIGRPIANTHVYLLDAHGQPVPLGAVGELYIGGAGVARGYLNRPELTAERFVPDPFSAEPDARMYKTGDLARYLPDGNLEFLGRNDHQVKIRGFRIELGEIEACLTAHPQVRDAVVVATGEGSNKRLVAYVQAEADEQLVSTLRAQVAARLPEYMVPSAFVRLDAFPLTPNGKLDRRALPAPDDAALAHQAYEAPQGELETTLAAIWAELLGVERVGRHDSFFALGGHSLLAVRLIERLRRRGLSMSVRALFEAPTLSALAQTLGQRRDVVVPPNAITPDTTAITPSMLPLIELTQADIDKIVEQVPGGVANIQDIYALSPLQDGLLFHHLLASTGDPYLLMVQLAFDTRARLDQYLHALQQVIDRHDILRTAFVWEGVSMPAQVVWRHARLPVTELTLDAADGPIAEQLARRFDPRHTRLDLTQAPLLHCAIAQDGEGRWLLTQRLHHLISDHSTLDVMHAEVRAFIEGRGDTLPPAQPFRYLVAQARLGVSQAEHEHFFTELLADVEPTLPFGLAQVQRDGSEVSESHRMLPSALSDRLRAHARRLGVSLASLCHLAWAQVLARASGQQRVVFGTVLFGRMQAGEGADRAMGLFINMLPLRVDLDGSVQAAVHATHARLAALLEHEHASLAQRCSGVPADMPLFSAMLNYRHNAMGSDERSGLPGVELLSAQERTHYPIGLSVDDDGQSLGLTAQSVPPLEPERVCAYMQQALQSLADALEATPDTAVQQLQVLPEAERQLLLNIWNATQRDYPSHLCVHQLFEAQVERTPEAPALVYEDQTFSYAQLNAQANRLAHQLIEWGVKPDARVAICVERSAALVVGLLAILKAGGAYVPLDPSYPGERLAHILTDAAPSIVLADAAGRAALGEAALAECTVLDPATLPALPDTNPSVAGLTARHLAYVIYTSGSTGTPKGVMVPHHAIARLVINNDYVDICTGDRVAFAANPAFDASTFEVWAPLLNGATVVVIDHDTVLMPAAFAHTLREQHISILWLTVGLFNQMAAQVDTAFSQLKVLIVGGDVLDARLVARVMRESPPEQLINGYGPTESTTFATTYKITSVPETNASLPIGRPIANTRVYLLDAHGQPVPWGAVGELYIGGAGVARGYLNRPELTAERFVRDPFSDEADARLYKTGDLVRYLPDGNLEFLGRNDDQIKIRGFRIEPGEIEACLTAHPQVRDAVVLATGEGSAKRLVAYVQAEADEPLASTLRSQLAARLPEYMVPSAFVRLDAFPLTPNGKLDRRALPAPDDAALAHQAYEAPQGELEMTLAAIWAELLGVERVGRHDSFFALGGHSLLAMRLINRVRTALEVDLAIRTLFETPTLAGLARHLVKRDGIQENSFSVLLPLKPTGSRPALFCIHPGFGLSWSYMGLSSYLHPDQPLYGLQARGLDGTSPLASTLDEMVSDYLEHMRRVQPKGPYCLLGWSFGGNVAHSMAVRLEHQGEKVALLALLDSTPLVGSNAFAEKENQLDQAMVRDVFAYHYSNELVSAMDEQLLENTEEIAKNNLCIVRDYSPSQYGGNALLFRATVAEAGCETLVSPDAWNPYVFGGIEVHDVHCSHGEMLKPEPTAIIGSTLACKLDKWESQQAQKVNTEELK
ncbi:non-ribosomal peptide synthase/polyketide synthase (plasmid) [Mycetohabitans rhizoxinica]|uniref:non-ribosomal peptide synthase/polyketide synthase n=1 Tax=Mycetohabitans rhizoxinica TaxID=412963 RepID=UPI0030CB6AA3